MIFQHRDGELRLYSGVTAGYSGATYAAMLFVNTGFSAPIARTKPIETLVMDRGVYDGNAEYRDGMDSEKLEPLPLSFSLSLIDDTTTQYFMRMIEGTSPLTVNGRALRSTKGDSKIDGVSTPHFSDTSKMAWDIEVLWDGTTDLGYRWREVYFPGAQQTINESEDSVILNVNGLVYGDVTRITALSTGSNLFKW